MSKRTLFGSWRGPALAVSLLAAVAAVGIVVFEPAFAESRVSSTVNGMTVTIIGDGSIGTVQGPDGIELRFNEHLVVVSDTEVVVDGESFAVTAEDEVVVDGSDGQFVVTVDGEEIVQ